MDERRHTRQNRQSSSDGYCDSRKTAGSSIENFKSSKDEPNGAMQTRLQRNESVCRERMPRASLTPRPPPPQRGGEHEGCNGYFHKQLCKGQLQKGIVLASLQGSTRVNMMAKAHSSCCSNFPEHLATTYPLRFLSNSCAIGSIH